MKATMDYSDWTEQELDERIAYFGWKIGAGYTSGRKDHYEKSILEMSNELQRRTSKRTEK